ncbi:acyl-CoA dehydrogenase family protein [Humibacillus sp. DSM 29435]|uniref:acyl-CoA dehydrogenase family protein n=1 Tax=Humibacillus sp. DSM 29435 TaxID=1869167 RepID=UPI0009F308D2|nr:acyl-CoA dehydrogenase family protein [Humibacillus sp. DSM 29435]
MADPVLPTPTPTPNPTWARATPADGRPLTSHPVADPDLVDVLVDLFDDYRSSRPGPSVNLAFDADLWGRLDALGLTRLSASEASGGSGAGWLEAAALLGIAAGAAAAVPVAEHDVLAAWLLESAGLPNDGRLRTVCRPDPSGVAINVTWASDAASIVALWEDRDEWRVADVASGRSEITAGRNLAGEPCDTVVFDLDDLEGGVVVDHSIGEQFHLRGALARSAQVVGGMDRVLEIVVAHVTERTQFGRPIGRFQAVQHLVADIAMEAALARSATDAAVARAAASDWSDPGMLFAVGVAKSCVGHAASVVVRGAHQALGAIGTTREHELHLLTKPILCRRSEFGSVHEWDETLAELASSAGHDRLWPLVLTGRAAPPSVSRSAT